jgi:hypothetical protein
MSTTDYVLAGAAITLVLWNMRSHALTDRRLVRPLIIAAAVCMTFLHGVPTSGADGVLVGLGVLTGAACGLIGALATRLKVDHGEVIASATPLAYGVTLLAFGGRLAFAIAATNGLGPAIGRFSRSVGIQSEKAWVAALVLMAVADLVVRALVLWQRRSVSLQWDLQPAR